MEDVLSVAAHPVPSAHRPRSWPRAREAAREFAATRAHGGDRPDAARVPLDLALGAALADDLVSPVAVPACDSAAMDGYAVAGAGPWRVVGRALAGDRRAVPALLPGQALEIATGAAVPAGAEAVLPYEDAGRVEGGTVIGGVRPGRHIRRRGEAVPAGATVAPAGAVVTPALLGLAAGLGHDTLRVRRPRVAALVTGDEVVASGRPGPAAVRDAIGPVLPGLVAWAGGTLVTRRHVPDGLDPLLAALRAVAHDPGTEVVAVCGASSVGPADHLRTALAELGARPVVDGVACRPGHPQMLAALTGGPIVVGLPGNPNAALVAALTLLVPALAALAGRADPAHAGRRARLLGDVAAHPLDTRLVGVRVHGDGAAPVGHAGSATLRGSALADALAVIPPRAEGGGGSAHPVELVELPR